MSPMKTKKVPAKEFLAKLLVNFNPSEGTSELGSSFEYLTLTAIKALNPSWKSVSIDFDLFRKEDGYARNLPVQGAIIVPDTYEVNVIESVARICVRCPADLSQVKRLFWTIKKFGEGPVLDWHSAMFNWIKNSDHEEETVSGCIKGLPIYRMISPMPKPPEHLYRGMSLYGDAPTKGRHSRFFYGTKRPACSWSESKDMAKSFGEYVLTISSAELLKQTVFLWPTVNTELEIILNLKRHLDELEWAVKIGSPMPVLSVDLPKY